MKISTKGRYALRVMLDLAEHTGDDFVPLKDICERQHLTVKYLEQIIALMNRAGFLVSSRGNGGGYRLKLSPAEYSVFDILKASEGKLCPAPCGGDCELYGKCAASDFWSGLEKAVSDYCSSKTLEDVLKGEKASSSREPSIWIL